MRPPNVINLMFFLLPLLVCAISLRDKTYTADDYLLTNSSQMRMDDLVKNQRAITATWRKEIAMSNVKLKSDRTRTSSHGTSQVSTTSALSGYFVTALYVDDKCTTVLSAAAYELNTCIDYGTFFRKIGATADAESETYYSDVLCTARKKELPSFIDYSASCVTTSKMQSTLAFVNSNGVPPSSLTMASIRLVHNMSLSCVTASVTFPCSVPCFLLFPFWSLSLLVASDLILCYTTLYSISSSHSTVSSQPLITHYHLIYTHHSLGPKKKR